MPIVIDKSDDKNDHIQHQQNDHLQFYYSNKLNIKNSIMQSSKHLQIYNIYLYSESFVKMDMCLYMVKLSSFVVIDFNVTVLIVVILHSLPMQVNNIFVIHKLELKLQPNQLKIYNVKPIKFQSMLQISIAHKVNNKQDVN